MTISLFSLIAALLIAESADRTVPWLVNLIGRRWGI